MFAGHRKAPKHSGFDANLYKFTKTRVPVLHLSCCQSELQVIMAKIKSSSFEPLVIQYRTRYGFTDQSRYVPLPEAANPK
jgi:hypothetical protein